MCNSNANSIIVFQQKTDKSYVLYLLNLIYNTPHKFSQMHMGNSHHQLTQERHSMAYGCV